MHARMLALTPSIVHFHLSLKHHEVITPTPRNAMQPTQTNHSFPSTSCPGLKNFPQSPSIGAQSPPSFLLPSRGSISSSPISGPSDTDSLSSSPHYTCLLFSKGSLEHGILRDWLLLLRKLSYLCCADEGAFWSFLNGGSSILSCFTVCVFSDGIPLLFY